jgi:hypothetical protein
MNSPVPLSGEFLPNDEIPATLLPILQTMCRDQLPDVLDVIEQNAAWLEQNPGGDLPRTLGMHPFTSGEAAGQRFISSFAQWMFQRPLEFYQQLTGEDRQRADDLLQSIGGFDALNTKINHRLKRKRGQLELVEDTA